MSEATTEIDNLHQIAQQIVENHCLPEQAKNRTVASGTPGRNELASLVGLLRDIVFPGFRPSSQLEKGEVVEHVHQRMLELREQLRHLFDWAIKQAGCSKADESNPVSDDICAEELMNQFFQSLPQVASQLTCDVKAAYEGDPACKSYQEIVICYPGFLAIVVYRFAHQLYLDSAPLLPRMLSEWVHSETGIDIHPGARIGNSFFIDHGTGVVIGETCEIGDHVKIYQGVTLGALSFPLDSNGQVVRNTKRHPTIEDRVVIYANATVLGGSTTVGQGSVIGSSVWLTSSVDPNTTVMMEEPKLRMRNQSHGTGGTGPNFPV